MCITTYTSVETYIFWMNVVIEHRLPTNHRNRLLRHCWEKYNELSSNINVYIYQSRLTNEAACWWADLSYIRRNVCPQNIMFLSECQEWLKISETSGAYDICFAKEALKFSFRCHRHPWTEILNLIYMNEWLLYISRLLDKNATPSSFSFPNILIGNTIRAEDRIMRYICIIHMYSRIDVYMYLRACAWSHLQSVSSIQIYMILLMHSR